MFITADRGLKVLGFLKFMERKNGLHPTVRRPERFHGIRTMPLIDLSFGRRKFKLPDNFPGPDSTVEEVRAYLLGPETYSFRGYSTRIPNSSALNHNSHP